ncbi:hypothetical protein Tco_1044855 [Tanacetum coccineum]|uniref:Uncharacterized protein n=1 Tax=Tanacetum coccineum TaxID=301880 RepID=A0ABQ5GRV0_9ASTR
MGDAFNCSTYSSANNYSPNLYTTPPNFSDYSCHDGEGNTPHDLQDNSCVALCSYCRGSHEDYCCTQLWCENGYPICETCGGYHMDHECFDIRDNEFKEKLKAQRIKNQELLDTFKEFCDSVIKKQREDRERIAKELRRGHFQNEFKNEKNSNSETIAEVPIKDSLLMVDEQINTTPSTDENKFDTFKCFSNPLFELDEEIISLEKDAFQNEVISNQEKINDTCETEEDLKFFDDLLNENTLPPDVSNVENDFQDNKEEIEISEADVPSFSDDSILRGIESDRDSGEDTTSIDDLPLDDSMILSEYESFTFDDEPVMAEVNVFDEINTSELSYPGIGENDVLDEEEDTFTFTTRTFLPFVTYPEVLPASYSTGSEDKVFNPGIFDNVLTRKSSLTLDVFDPLHPPLMDFNVTKAFFGFTFSLLKIFSKKFYEPGITNAMVFRILEDSWFKIVEGQSNAHNLH